MDPETTTCAIVDDHEVVRAGMRGRLASVDWIQLVGEASTAGEARALLRRTQPRVVLMDVRLPDGDGLQVARSLLDEGGPTRVVLYSGSATTRQAEHALEAGVSGFVLKDSSLETVIDALAAARDGRRYIDPTIAAELFASSSGGMKPLSPREHEILTLMAEGSQNAGIAHDLGISAETVKAHVSNLFVKLDVESRTQAVATALRAGIID